MGPEAAFYLRQTDREEHSREQPEPSALFVAGDEPEAKRVALELAAELRFRAEDAGSLANAKPLEGMVKVWLALARQHGRTVVFAISDG